ncbi:hypothetical protein SAMN04489712_107147 [Thermomonospora echinospora]|uniref:Uncharacterized protein n=1 Tax=Thermomonospora echinospora TaxID=1992 RepID=A0A1H6BIU4_9ACTN|nr:hypothetical protein [Thermomonospora echinospora]SEG60659.1 hypothetical protein SAMN04489712_107147 [Thermomonospora echinospora]
MTTHPHDEHGEILRRALHAEADRVEPAPDGLERIRAGIERRSRRRFAGLAGWAPVRFWPPGGWSRPVLAVGAAVAIVAVGVSAPQTIDRITSAGRHGPADGDERPSGAVSGTGSAGQVGQLPPAAGPGQQTAPLPGQPPTSPVPGAPGAPPCTPVEQPSPGQPSATAGPEGPQLTATPCPEPSGPSASPEPSDEPSSPEPTEPQEPPTDPNTPSPTPEPQQTESP